MQLRARLDVDQVRVGSFADVTDPVRPCLLSTLEWTFRIDEFTPYAGGNWLAGNAAQ